MPVLLGFSQLSDPLPAQSTEKPIGLQDCVMRSALSLHFLKTAKLSLIMPLR